MESAFFMWIALGDHAATAGTPFIVVGAVVAIYGAIVTSRRLPALRRLTPEASRFPKAYVASLIVLPGLGAVAAGLVALSRS